MSGYVIAQINMTNKEGFKINVLGAKKISEYCLENDIYLINISKVAKCLVPLGRLMCSKREIKFNSDQIRAGLRKLNIPFIENDSHIIPILVKDPVLCKDAANLLVEKHGIYIQPVFFPTVPKGDERFRVTITPKHSAEDVQTFVNSLDKVWSKLNLKRAKKITSRVSKISNLF